MSSTQRPTGGCGTGAPGGEWPSATQTTVSCGPSLRGRGHGRFVPAWLGGSRGMILGAIAVVGAGLAFGWPIFVALGVAPILLSFLPCAAMCALGLCAMGNGRQAVLPSLPAPPVPFR
jgi:hypothetical protein